jgi:hypothetical protein
MSNEQSLAPQSDQPNWYGQASFIPGEQVDFHKSNLESVAVFQARQAIAAAISTAPSGTLEVKAVDIDKKPETPSQEMQRIARMLQKMRQAYDENTFDLETDDPLSIDALTPPKPDVTTITKDDVSLAA